MTFPSPARQNPTPANKPPPASKLPCRSLSFPSLTARPSTCASARHLTDRQRVPSASTLLQLTDGSRKTPSPFLLHREASNSTAKTHAAVVATTTTPRHRRALRKAPVAEGRPPWRARRSTSSPSIRTTAAWLSVCAPSLCFGETFPVAMPSDLPPAGTSKGFRIYHTDPFSRIFSSDDGNIAIIEMLFSTSLVALILSPRHLVIQNTKVRLQHQKQRRFPTHR